MWCVVDMLSVVCSLYALDPIRRVQIRGAAQPQLSVVAGGCGAAANLIQIQNEESF